jgi:membrane protease YdiL (CAAX protease family)
VFPARAPLSRSDVRFIASCCVIAAVSLFIVFRWFGTAFPEASIDFRYDRGTSAPIAERVLRSQHVDVAKLKHTVVFDDDDVAKLFLERSLGLEKSQAVMKNDVRLWYWQHRWFLPLQEEEYRIDVAPTGEIVAYSRHIEETRALPSGSLADARALAESFLRTCAVPLGDLQLVAQSERNLPKRVQRIFTWDSRAHRPAGAPYRFSVTIDGNLVTDYAQRLQVPDAWRRGYSELRSKNYLAGNVDTIFFALTVMAALVVFIRRLLAGDLQLELLGGVALVAAVLTAGVAINNFPGALAGYETTSSYPAFLTRFIFLNVLLGAVGVAMFLVVLVGAGESLYRQRFPQHLALSRIWSWRALQSRRVFRAFVLAYTLVAAFFAYQVAFYLIANHFGAWSPAEVPYDGILNSAIPWVAVLFAGFFPGLSEEFLSRAFSIPFFERVFKSRVAAIVISGFIWGFGHATYPNQPFFIRGLEVGIAGVALGFLMYRFGVLPLVMWHFTIDALYTALLLFRSGNRYYIASAAISSLVFAIPMLLSIALYLKNRGFVDDDDLSNDAVGTAPELPPVVRPHEHDLPPADTVTSRRFVASAAVIVVAALLLVTRPASVDDAIDYAMTKQSAIVLAQKYVASKHAPVPQRVAATVQNGFRSWNADSSRQDGGAPAGFDGIAANYLVHHGATIAQLTDILRAKVRAGNWLVRLFTPLEKRELYVEVDPRTHDVIGFTEYREEAAPGARLEQPAAVAIATRAMLDHGFDTRAFDLKEALSFQQPNRRDWLLHFQERTPLARDAYRRVTVRVMGADVTQLVTTVKVPDAAYREASKSTLLSVLAGFLRLIGGVAILALIIAGFVVIARHSGFPWQRALRWTAILAIIPIAGTLIDLDPAIFSYQTSTQWWTFIGNEIIDNLRGIGMQLGLLFLALVAIDAIVPYVSSLASREARARLGRGAVLASLTTIAAVVAIRTLLQLIAQHFPSMLSVQPPDLTSSVGIPLPAVFELGDSLIRALELSAALGLFIVALRSFNRTWAAATLSITFVFLASLDGGVEPARVPLMLASAAALALLSYVCVRCVLRENVLAYPLTIFTAMTLQNAATLASNSRADLRVNAIAEIVVLLLINVLLVTARSQRMTTSGPAVP